MSTIIIVGILASYLLGAIVFSRKKGLSIPEAGIRAVFGGTLFCTTFLTCIWLTKQASPSTSFIVMASPIWLGFTGSSYGVPVLTAATKPYDNFARWAMTSIFIATLLIGWITIATDDTQSWWSILLVSIPIVLAIRNAWKKTAIYSIERQMNDLLYELRLIPTFITENGHSVFTNEPFKTSLEEELHDQKNWRQPGRDGTRDPYTYRQAFQRGCVEMLVTKIPNLSEERAKEFVRSRMDHRPPFASWTNPNETFSHPKTWVAASVALVALNIALYILAS